MAFLFKNGEQLYNEGLDLIGRKDFQGAKKKFGDAIQKGCGNKDLAEVYIAVIDVGAFRGNIKCYQALIDRLGVLGGGSFKFGLTDLDVNDLITEAQCDIMEIEAHDMPDSQYNEKSAKLIACAGEFMSRIGEKTLKFDEVFKGNTIATGSRESLILQAQAYYLLGTSTVASDPKAASEYMQMAYNFRRQVGDSGDEELRLSRNYARSCKCWICGRPANGEGIHFQAMRSTVAPAFQNETQNDIIKPLADDGQHIYVCMPCYTAISNRSDEIAQVYYNQCMAEMRAMEARLQAEISSISMRVSMTSR